MIRYEVSEKSVLWETKNSFDVYYVNTFDIPSAKKSAQSQLTQQLDMLLYQRQKDVYSFTDYRLETTTRPRENVSQEHIHDFLNIINRFFASTGKTIHINERNEIVFDKTTFQSTYPASPCAKKSPVHQAITRLFVASSRKR